MTELNEIIPSGAYLSAKTAIPGTKYIIREWSQENSRFKEGQKNLVLTLQNQAGEEQKITLNKQSRLNLASKFGQTLEKWVGQTIEIGYLRPTQYGLTIDMLPSATPMTPAAGAPPSPLENVLSLLKEGGKTEGVLKAAAQAKHGIALSQTENIITTLKNSGMIIEKNGVLEAV